MDDKWFSRSPLLLALGLVALALGFFIEWRGWWNGAFGLAGVALLALWVYRASDPARRGSERRSPGRERRRHAEPVDVERRLGDRRVIVV